MNNLTVIIPTIDTELEIINTIDTLLLSTRLKPFEDYDILIVNNSQKILDDISNLWPKLKIINQCTRVAAYKNFKCGIDSVDTEWAVFLAIGDQLYSGWLESFNEFIRDNRHNSTPFLMGDIIIKYPKNSYLYSTKKYCNINQLKEYISDPFGFGIYAIFNINKMKTLFVIANYEDWSDYIITLYIAKSNLFYYLPGLIREYEIKGDTYKMSTQNTFANPFRFLYFYLTEKKQLLNINIRFVLHTLKITIIYNFNKLLKIKR